MPACHSGNNKTGTPDTIIYAELVDVSNYSTIKQTIKIKHREMFINANSSVL
jgi:hypothetical protein